MRDKNDECDRRSADCWEHTAEAPTIVWGFRGGFLGRATRKLGPGAWAQMLVSLNLRRRLFQAKCIQFPPTSISPHLPLHALPPSLPSLFPNSASSSAHSPLHISVHWRSFSIFTSLTAESPTCQSPAIWVYPHHSTEITKVTDDIILQITGPFSVSVWLSLSAAFDIVSFGNSDFLTPLPCFCFLFIVHS